MGVAVDIPLPEMRAGRPERGSVVRAMFAAIAPRYDLLNRVLSLRQDVRWRRAATRAAAVPPGGRVLDLCTGTADLALEIARQSPGAREIVAVDFCAPMLVLGRKKVRRAGEEARIRLGEASAEALPFRDGVFDAALVAFGLRNLTDWRRGLAEMHRVLRPAGRAVILDFAMPPGRVFRSLYLLYFHRILPVVGRIVSGHPTAYSYLPASVGEFPEPDGLTALLQEIGFRAVSCRLLSGGIVALHVGVR